VVFFEAGAQDRRLSAPRPWNSCSPRGLGGYDEPMTHPFAGARFDELIRMPRASLEGIMRHGTTPTADHLDGWEFRGYNPPIFARVLGFQKFIKGFFRDSQGLAGYNLFVQAPRGGPDRPWIAKGGGDPRARHGYYDVVAVQPGGRYSDFPDAVLLDYGSGRNSALNPESRIRDFLVQVDPDNPDLYLGKAFLDLGIARMFSNFFVLERLQRAPT